MGNQNKHSSVRRIVATREMAAGARGFQVHDSNSGSALCIKVISDVLRHQQIKKDKDVEELYLANKGLTDVCDLQRFRFLKRIWLNGNKLRQISCFPLNYRISELHLNDNELIDISGSLSHLTCLQLCMLHNNQLTKLEKVTTEFNKMQNLHTLNLFDNPIAQEPGYRLFVVHHCPSIQLLDRHEVTKQERDMARRIYDQSEEKVRERVAFGRRSQGPPSLYYPGTPRSPGPTGAGADDKVFGNNYLRNNPVFEDQEDAVNSRRLKKSLTLYSSFDWSKVPRIQQRRTSEHTFGNPEIITRVYR